MIGKHREDFLMIDKNWVFAILFILLCFFDLLTIRCGRRLQFSFLLIDNSRKKVDDLHSEQNTVNRISMNYVKQLTHENSSLSYDFFHGAYILELISLIPQYFLIFILFCLNHLALLLVMLISVANKFIAYLFFSSNFNSMRYSKKEEQRIISMKKYEINSLRIKYIVALALIIFVILLMFSGLCILSGSWDNTVAYIVPYDFINSFLCYDHIMYNGEHYYIIGTIPDEYDDIVIPFSGEKIYVTLALSEGDPHDPERREEAWTYQNDEAMRFIYYGSAAYTKDKRFINEWAK